MGVVYELWGKLKKEEFTKERVTELVNKLSDYVDETSDEKRKKDAEKLFNRQGVFISIKQELMTHSKQFHGFSFNVWDAEQFESDEKDYLWIFAGLETVETKCPAKLKGFMDGFQMLFEVFPTILGRDWVDNYDGIKDFFTFEKGQILPNTFFVPSKYINEALREKLRTAPAYKVHEAKHGGFFIQIGENPFNPPFEDRVKFAAHVFGKDTTVRVGRLSVKEHLEEME